MITVHTFFVSLCIITDIMTTNMHAALCYEDFLIKLYQDISSSHNYKVNVLHISQRVLLETYTPQCAILFRYFSNPQRFQKFEAYFCKIIYILLMYLRAWPPLYSGWSLSSGFHSSKQLFELEDTIISNVQLADV